MALGRDTHTAFSTETFLDELAAAAGRDPFELRRELLADHPRHRVVLELAAAKAGWGSPLPAGRARGIAVHESFNSFVANVVEVSLRKDGLPKVERVVCAVDCGVAVNPDVVRAQMEGSIGFGLGAALWSEITLDKGRVVQSNFHDYRTLRIDEMPKVEVHIVPSSEAPTGVGEPGVPCGARSGERLLPPHEAADPPVALRARPGEGRSGMKPPALSRVGGPGGALVRGGGGGGRRRRADASHRGKLRRDRGPGEPLGGAFQRGGQGAPHPPVRQLPPRFRSAAPGR